MKLAFAALTDVGLVRQNNEDNFVVLDLAAGSRFAPPPASCEGIAQAQEGGGMLVAVADGMGGALAGEVASRIAVDLMATAAAAIEPREDAAQSRQRMLDAIVAANEQIHHASLENPQQRGMGTTLTAALIRGNLVQFFQVGDSKGYLVRKGKLQQMTRSHSLIDRLVEDKVISAEDAEKLEGGKNIILQALGPDTRVDIDYSESALAEGDSVLLCTDGLHGCVRRKDIEAVVGAATDSGKLCEDLVRQARDRGAPDNVTVIAVAVLESGAPPPVPGLMGRISSLLRRKKPQE